MTSARLLATTFAAAIAATVGCAERRDDVAHAFPPANTARPWLPRDALWTGTFADAVPGLGRDATEWSSFGPRRVWLAIYCHEDHPERCLTVRCFAFATPDDATAAFGHSRPPQADTLQAGEEGCWTPIGVLFRWGCLVVEIFGADATWDSQVQSALLAGFMTKRMPAGAPLHPQ